jgi:4'-phosphopantetheinyl transferase
MPTCLPVRAAKGIVHVWHADLAVAGDGLENLLCAQELARAARIVPARRRIRWARSRGILRALLGRYLDCDPRTLRFVPGPHGKPALHREEGRGGTDLRFNLSHSGEILLLAVTAGREVGVDVERIRQRYTPELLRAWTLREAAVKCLGTGLTSAPANPAANLWSTELPAGPAATAAVAVEGGRPELAFREWRA